MARIQFIRKIYDWVLHWAKTPYAISALAILSFAESSFFPIPPDVLLIPLCIGNHKKWLKFALVCSAASILGGVFGYAIGKFAYNLIGTHILEFVGMIVDKNALELRDIANSWFNTPKTVIGITTVWGPWAVGIAGFTPIPYKVFTITAGFFNMNIIWFVIATLISRSARFFIVAGIIGLTYKYFGDRIQKFIDKYFNLLSILFVVLLLGGFALLKYVK